MPQHRGRLRGACDVERNDRAPPFAQGASWRRANHHGTGFGQFRSVEISVQIVSNRDSLRVTRVYLREALAIGHSPKQYWRRAVMIDDSAVAPGGNSLLAND
jgi:hypothetical protein